MLMQMLLPHANATADADPDANTDANTDANAAADADADANADADADPNADAIHTDTDTANQCHQLSFSVNQCAAQYQPVCQPAPAGVCQPVVYGS